MMVFRYGFGVDIEVGGPFGFVALTPKEAITAVNFSTIILIVHGWLYVGYLYSDFRLWSLVRWPLWKFGLVPSAASSHSCLSRSSGTFTVK
jgi:hypothetical protein